jgi:hypothetical protein
MKKKLLVAALLLLSFFSVSTFAQGVPGGEADGGGGPAGEPKSQPSPVKFKRNNGNGTCGREAEIRVYFKIKPDYMPTIQRVMYEGSRINVDINPIDTSMLAKKGYVSYCIGNTNIPPACMLSLIFNYYQSNQTFLLEENKGPK